METCRFDGLIPRQKRMKYWCKFAFALLSLAPWNLTRADARLSLTRAAAHLNLTRAAARVNLTRAAARLIAV